MSVQAYSLFCQSEDEREAIFGGCRKGFRIMKLPQEHLVVIKVEKVCCCSLDPLTNKHCRVRNSMIKLWIDSRTCQKYRILLSARQRSNNYLELSKENLLGNMMLSRWPCITWKFFMVWFQKILQLIFQKQPACPRNICTQHWRKLPIFTAFLKIFLYLNNNDFVKSFANCVIHLFPKENKVFSLHRSSCFEFLLWFSSGTLLSKLKLLFFSLWKFAKFLMSFRKAQVSFPSNFASIFSAIKHNSFVLF